jgi:hypothetical protein
VRKKEEKKKRKKRKEEFELENLKKNVYNSGKGRSTNCISFRFSSKANTKALAIA